LGGVGWGGGGGFSPIFDPKMQIRSHKLGMLVVY